MYVERDAQNNIIALYALPQPGRATVAIADDEPSVVAFATRDTEPLSDIDVRLALLEDAGTGRPNKAAIDAKRTVISTRNNKP